MKLVVLWSATSVPNPQRTLSPFWLWTSPVSLLLDLGPDASDRMAQENVDWPNLDAIWISHFHLDHFGGLAPFLFGAKWAPKMRGRTKPLTIFGPGGVNRLLEKFDTSNNYRLFEQKFAVKIVEVAAAADFEILPDVCGRGYSTPHTEESLALRVSETNGPTIVYTSDTGYATQLAEFAAGCDLLLIEASFRRGKPIKKHLELADAMKLAELANAKRVVLTHLYPEWDGVDIAAEALALWSGEVIGAFDGLTVLV